MGSSYSIGSNALRQSGNQLEAMDVRSESSYVSEPTQVFSRYSEQLATHGMVEHDVVRHQQMVPVVYSLPSVQVDHHEATHAQYVSKRRS